jgi:hypothetical protein
LRELNGISVDEIPYLEESGIDLTKLRILSL